jgi:hypothetical protein
LFSDSGNILSPYLGFLAQRAVVSFSLFLALLRNIYWLPYKPPKLWLKFTVNVPSIMKKVSLTALQLYWDLVYLHPGSWENVHARTFNNGFQIWQ